MTALLLAALLQAASAPAAAHAAPPPPSAMAPATTVAIEPDLDAPTSDGLESLNQTYHDSCEVRLYGEYDDMCSALAGHIRQYRAALAKAERKPRGR